MSRWLGFFGEKAASTDFWVNPPKVCGKNLLTRSMEMVIFFDRSNCIYIFTITTNGFFNVFKNLNFIKQHNEEFCIHFDNGFWKVNPKIKYFTKYLLSLFVFSNNIHKLLLILFVITWLTVINIAPLTELFCNCLLFCNCPLADF